MIGIGKGPVQQYNLCGEKIDMRLQQAHGEFDI